VAENLSEERLAELTRWLFNLDAGPADSTDGASKDRVVAAIHLFRHLFLPPPTPHIDARKSEAFNRLMEDHCSSATNADMPYSLPYPKWEFLTHTARERGLLFHGSSRARLDVLEPGPQTDWSGRPIQAVFATADPIWPMFFATMNWSRLAGSIRNGGFLVEKMNRECERFYLFSANTDSTGSDLFQKGTVHLVDREGFATNPCPVRFDEWHCPSPVPVLARLDVELQDFPFRDAVTRHTEEESVYLTWLRYRSRVRDVIG